VYSIDLYKKLAIKKARMEAGLFLVEGERAVSQICTSYPDAVVEIACTEDYSEKYNRFPQKVVTENQFRKFSTVKSPQGIAALVRHPERVYDSALPDNPGTRILLLDSVQDPGNTGTLIRSAAAFGFDGILLSDKCADPFSPKAVQSTAGSVLSLWIRKTQDYIDLGLKLKAEGFKFVSADQNAAESPDILKDISPIILAMGNEASGLSSDVRKITDIFISISMDASKVESLNVAVSGAICMYFTSYKDNSRVIV